MKTLRNLIIILITFSTSTTYTQEKQSWENTEETLQIGKAGPSLNDEYGAIAITSTSTKKDEHIRIKSFIHGAPITSINKDVLILFRRNNKVYKSQQNKGTIKIKIIKNAYPPTYKIDISATLKSSETGEEIKISESITTTPTITCRDDQNLSETNAGNTIPNFCLRIAGLTP